MGRKREPASQRRGIRRRGPSRALAATSNPKRAVGIFCAYSHQDEQHREDLEKHLSTLKRNGLIALWHDRKILPGDTFGQVIDDHLDTADMVLLLISPDFLNSEYCYRVEMQRAIERHEAGQTRVIPIIVRPALWQDSPLGTLLALPRDAKPVTRWTNRDQAWVEVVLQIRRAITEILSAAPAEAISASGSQPVSVALLPRLRVR